jgi:hypothetical protein
VDCVCLRERLGLDGSHVEEWYRYDIHILSCLLRLFGEEEREEQEERRVQRAEYSFPERVRIIFQLPCHLGSSEVTTSLC